MTDGIYLSGSAVKANYNRMLENTKDAAGFYNKDWSSEKASFSPNSNGSRSDVFKSSPEAVFNSFAEYFKPGKKYATFLKAFAEDAYKAENDESEEYKEYYDISKFFGLTKNQLAEETGKLKKHQLNYVRRQKSLVKEIKSNILGSTSLKDLKGDKSKTSNEDYSEKLDKRQLAAADRLGALIRHESNFVSAGSDLLEDNPTAELTPSPILAETIFESLKRSVEADTDFGSSKVMEKDSDGELVSLTGSDGFASKTLADIMKDPKYDVSKPVRSDFSTAGDYKEAMVTYRETVSSFAKTYLANPHSAMAVAVVESLDQTGTEMKKVSEAINKKVSDEIKKDKAYIWGSKESERVAAYGTVGATTLGLWGVKAAFAAKSVSMGAFLFGNSAAAVGSYASYGLMGTLFATGWAVLAIPAAIYLATEIYDACANEEPDGLGGKLKDVFVGSGSWLSKIGRGLA